jgi:hypothetical protein
MPELLAEPENKFRTFYHGTYPDRIDSILRTGLDPSYVGGGGGTLPGLNEKDPRPKLFLTTSPSYAEFYANMAAKTSAMAKAKEEGKGWFRQMLAQGTPAPPLRIDLPSDFKVHELAKGLGGHDEHYVTDLIPPEYIKAMNRLEKAAAFGAMMGKQAAFTVANPTERRLIGGAAGALVGGLGTAGYDWLRGTKENKLKRALMGAGLGGLTGVGLGQLTNLIDPSGPKAPAPETEAAPEPATASVPAAAPVDERLIPVKSHFTPEDFRRGSEFPYGFDFNEYNLGKADRERVKTRNDWHSAMDNFGYGTKYEKSVKGVADRAFSRYLDQKYPDLHGLSKDGPYNINGKIYNPKARKD